MIKRKEFSAEGQVINGGNGEYYDSFYAPNIIYDENSELLAPYKVSNCGYYNEETKTACWDRLCGIKKLYLYDFSLIRYSFLTQILKVLINFS